MANKTIYPYGVGGQTPSGIDIVNDLVTGGADKALAAQQGKVLNGKIKALWASLVDYAFINGKPQIFQTYTVTMPSGSNITSALKDANGNALETPVIEGTNINIVLTPTSGYSIEIDSVKMGGQTLQEETDYTINDNGDVKTISIPHISGNIVVIASAQSLFTVDLSELDGVTSSNSSTVVSGGSYYTKLGTSNNLYVVDDSSVQVTMGGLDVTSQVHENDEITIPNVTGDIVISASSMTYVANGLVLHLDGKNRGGVSGKWISLVSYNNESGFNEPIEFTLSNDTTKSGYDESKNFVEQEDHIDFKGFTRSTSNLTSLPIASLTGTIETAYNNAEFDADRFCILQNTTGNATVGSFISFNSYYSSSIGDSDKIYLSNSCKGPSSSENNQLYIGRYKSVIVPKSDIRDGGFYSLTTEHDSTVAGLTYFFKNNVQLTRATNANQAGAVMNTDSSSVLLLMCRHASSSDYCSIGSLYSVRVYNRRLTDAERTQNYKVDLKRFPTVIQNAIENTK